MVQEELKDIYEDITWYHVILRHITSYHVISHDIQSWNIFSVMKYFLVMKYFPLFIAHLSLKIYLVIKYLDHLLRSYHLNGSRRTERYLWRYHMISRHITSYYVISRHITWYSVMKYFFSYEIFFSHEIFSIVHSSPEP